MTTLPALALQQQALLDALFATPPAWSAGHAAPDASKDAFAGDARGMLAYRSNAHALAERTLRATYPVIAQLLGADSFNLLARDFWHCHPPALGDLAQWGEPLADFLQANGQLAAEPYLGDVARVEWALHVAAGAADRAPDPASFALLSTREPAEMTLLLSSGVAVVSSVYPVASIVTAHLHASPTLQEAGEKLRVGAGECALVWRRNFRPRVAACSAPEAAFVEALQGGVPLLSALEGAGGLDFQQWLPAAVRNGLVLGATAIGG